MRFLTTLVLAGLVAGGVYFLANRPEAVAPPAGSAQILETEITADALTRVEIDAGGEKVVLYRTGSTWSLPGDWPTRKPEVEQLIGLLTSLRTRFAPAPYDQPKQYGLDPSQNPVVVTVALERPSGEKTYRLSFGEPPPTGPERFTRPTYLRIDDRDEVLRLGPDLLPSLRRPREDYLRRQLFTDTVRLKIDDPNRFAMSENEAAPAAVPLLDVPELRVLGPDGSFTLKQIEREPQPKSAAPPTTTAERLARRWELAAPVTDRPEPERLRNVLAAVPDIWAEQFVAETDPAKTGLDNPERTIEVVRDGRGYAVQIGNVSRVREVRAAAPPPANPFSPPPPAPPPTREEYRYAKLANNPQVFEVRADKFNDLFVKPDDLRDPRVARFRSADATRLEVRAAGQALVFAKEKSADGDEERWRLIEPARADAEPSRITELLDKLAGLETRDADRIDTADAAKYGFDADPGRVVVTLSEAVPGSAAKAKESRSVTFLIGKADDTQNKLYVRLDGNPRVNAVADDLLKLIDRPAVAYRSRRVLDVPARQIARIAVTRPDEQFALAPDGDDWKLIAPVRVAADAGKAGSLAGDLGRLEVVEFITDAPTEDELKKFGLDAPALRAEVAFTDPGRRPEVLLVGQARAGKPEYYAKLESSPGVFAIRQTVRDAIDQPSLAFRPLQIWRAEPIDVTEIAIARSGTEFRLTREASGWKISGPFDAPAYLMAVQDILDAVASLRAEKFESHAADDLARFGLDQPAFTITVTAKSIGTKTLLVGRATEGAGGHFAKRADADGVFVVGPGLVRAADKPALDLLDRRVVSIFPGAITHLKGTGPDGEWSAKKAGDAWLIDSIRPPAAGDRAVLNESANAWDNVQALKFVDYGPSVDLARYGLDAPTATATAIVTGDAADPTTHTLAIGATESGEARYARLDNGPAVFVLQGTVVKQFLRSGLELVDRSLLNFNPRELSSVRRQMGGETLELVRREDGWFVARPGDHRGDDETITALAEWLGRLRADRIAALSVREPQKFGLASPTATIAVVVRSADGSPMTTEMVIGDAALPDGRYVQVVGQETVAVVAGANLNLLLADPLRFRERPIARFPEPDRIDVTRFDRTTTFAKVDGRWAMTVPVRAEAEVGDLEEIARTITRLRAEEMIAEKPNDLRPFGLDKPEAVWTFHNGETAMLQLLIGSKEPNGSRRFAKRADGDFVVKLDANLSEKLTSEMRRRSLFQGLDAAQIQTLTITDGGEALVLRKEGGTWTAQNRPGTLNVEAITDVLAGLSTMRAERYAADRLPNLKLYSLDPIRRSLIATAANGATFTLYVGGPVGGGSQVYAAVPGSGAVAVLSEDDSGRVTKPIRQFLE